MTNKKLSFTSRGVTYLLLGLLGLGYYCFADTIVGSLRVSPNLTHTGTGGGSATLRESIDTLMSWTITGSTQDVSLTKLYVESITLTAGASTNIDLYGSLTDSFGVSVSFSNVKFMAFGCRTNYAAVGIGGAAANAMTNWVRDTSDIVNVNPNSWAFFFSPIDGGYAVSNGVADTLSITNYHATSNAYIDIYISGMGI